MDALVSTTWLAREIRDGHPRRQLRVVDVRHYLDPARRGRDAWRAGHIPGALFLDIDEDLSAPGGGRGRMAGRHPWPGEEQVARVMSASGIGPGTRVVAYDDASGGTAARLWYLLRAHGHDKVAVLDGGIAKWSAEGHPVTTEEPRFEPAVFVARLRRDFVVSKAEMVRDHGRRLVLDARAAERFRGEVEPLDPVAGHIPGALNRFFRDNLGADGCFKPAAVLRAEFAVLLGGDDPAHTVHHCGSGVTACHNLLAMEHVGLAGSVLYPGSWSEWSADPARPVARG
jgi:thiosulfate/3-mercaptopyruvate sulfurtransferase